MSKLWQFSNHPLATLCWVGGYVLTMSAILYGLTEVRKKQHVMTNTTLEDSWRQCDRQQQSKLRGQGRYNGKYPKVHCLPFRFCLRNISKPSPPLHWSLVPFSTGCSISLPAEFFLASSSNFCTLTSMPPHQSVSIHPIDPRPSGLYDGLPVAQWARDNCGSDLFWLTHKPCSTSQKLNPLWISPVGVPKVRRRIQWPMFWSNN